MKLKVCGVATLSDVEQLVELGVDMIGMVIEPGTPRYVGREFLTATSPFRGGKVKFVAVSVTLKVEEIPRLLDVVDLVQIHREMTEEEIERLKQYADRIIAYVPADQGKVTYGEKVAEAGFIPLLDTKSKGEKIGKDIVLKFREVTRSGGIAGRLGIADVTWVKSLSPSFMDVSRSVEAYPGKKDMGLVKELLEAVRS